MNPEFTIALGMTLLSPADLTSGAVEMVASRHPFPAESGWHNPAASEPGSLPEAA